MRRAIVVDAKAALLLGGALLLAVGLALPTNAAFQGTGGGTGGTQQPAMPAPGTLPVLGNADSNNAMIAVTGIDLTGSSILYLVDTVHRQIAVYQASGGTPSTQGVRLVGARRIDLDLQLEGYNDKSEYSFEDLEKRFAGLRTPAGGSK